jgi:hypothetical protein
MNWLFIAQLMDSPKDLVGYGALGIVSAWLMWRDRFVGSKLDTLAHRIDGMTRAMLIDVISRDTAGQNARSAAQEMLNKIQSRDRD